jgi:iron complex transport system substrate-binding protein
MKGEKLKRLSVIVAIAAVIVISSTIGGCAGKVQRQKADEAPPAKPFPLAIFDDTGRKVTVAKRPERIVSLAPSNTEILFALGLGDKVVGVTTYDDYPEEAKTKEKVGDFAKPNVEKILSLQPDLVLATGGLHAGLVENLDKLGKAVFVVDSKGIEGIFSSIEKIGKATDAIAEARALNSKLRGKIEKIRAKTAKLSPEERPRVFYELYSDPLMSAGPGTYIDGMIEIAGGTNIASETKEEYPQYSLETLLQRDPEVYIAVKGPMLDPGDISKRSGWQGITAIKLNRIHLVDDNLVSRPGPRMVKGLESIARAIHPELFPPAQEAGD